ncbi:MAG: T9SS type A sorting domain-containing protein [Rhodothermaceae bacterium]|nr:T9SS type A sorting domain-containing protein [Rhodothermaceae bacterium]MXX58570.1 T9SS type A sorting domain-containing protein [Rhodothermaceae bacterium]MYD20420.1 T9SS type A sorting domain-containing protein [Rhodothermaceae bacterium]MYI44247.1 T9SS type A sorting domain-containing protein [Rhodothermaceae bacterium]MYJ55092.1 T9SS type A sorting domain-containing protein [Rhodothermaceae bacterium]
MRVKYLSFAPLVVLSVLLCPLSSNAQLLWERTQGFATESVDFSPDGKRLLVGSDAFDATEVTIAVYDTDTGDEIYSIAEGVPVTSAVFSPDGTLFVEGYFDGTVRVRDVSTQDIVATFGGHDSQVFAVDFQPPHGAMVVSGANFGDIKLWDVATGQNVATSEFGDGLFAVWDLQFSPDGTRIAAVGSQQVKVWETANLATGQEIITLEDANQGTFEGPESVRWSRDKTMLAAGYDEGKIRLWDVASESLVSTLEGHGDEINSLDFLHTGKVLISGSDDETVRLWDLDTESLIVTIEPTVPFTDCNVSSVRFSPDGSRFATADCFDRIALWSSAQWIDVPTSISDDTLPTEVVLAQNYPNPFNPSTAIAYTLDRSGPVQLSVYDLTGRIVSTLVDSVQPAGHYELRFSADNLPSGTYMYRLQTSAEMLTRAMTLLR